MDPARITGTMRISSKNSHSVVEHREYYND